MVHYLTNSIIEMNHSTNYTRIKQIAKGLQNRKRNNTYNIVHTVLILLK